MPGAFDTWELLLHWNIFRSILILLQRIKGSCIDQIIMCSFLFGLDLWKFCCNALHCVIVHNWNHSVHFVSLQSTRHWIFDEKQIESCNFQKLIHNSRSCSTFFSSIFKTLSASSFHVQYLGQGCYRAPRCNLKSISD